VRYQTVRARKRPSASPEVDPDAEPTGHKPDRGSRQSNPIQPIRPVRILATLVVLAATVLAAGIGAPSTARASTTAEIGTDALNLRTDPGTWADVIAVMGWGETVEVLDGPTDDGWYEVSYGGEVGWAFGDYLAFDGVGSGGGGGGERWIDVDRSTQQITLYVGDAPIESFWGAMGYDQSDDGFYATAIGTYYVYAKNADLAWTDYGQAYIADWVAFDPDRANGFHSWSLDADGNVLPWGDGPTGGCVALEPWAAATLYDFAEIGMRVEVHW
jgi:hypothetical protein